MEDVVGGDLGGVEVVLGLLGDQVGVYLLDVVRLGDDAERGRAARAAVALDMFRLDEAGLGAAAADVEEADEAIAVLVDADDGLLLALAPAVSGQEVVQDGLAGLAQQVRALGRQPAGDGFSDEAV